jgi:hypothetical protein
MRFSFHVSYHSISVPGFTKNCISICSNSRMRNTNCRATISLRKALPVCAMPKGIFIRALFCTLRKFTKMPLCRFGTQVDGAALAAHAAELGGEHQVELAHLGPVGRAADRALDLLVDDQLAHPSRSFASGRPSCAFHRVDAVLAALHVGVGGAELHFIEGARRTSSSPSRSPWRSCPRTWPCAPPAARRRGSASCCPCCRSADR